jgi:hypothetical protein
MNTENRRNQETKRTKKEEVMEESIDKSRTENSRTNLRRVVMNRKIIIAICFIFAAYGIAHGDYLLVDQGYVANVDSWHNLSYYRFAQQFTPSLSSIDMVRLALHTNEEGAVMRINIREGSIYGPVIGTSTKVIPPGFTGMTRFVFVSSIPLNPGSTYTIDVEKPLSGSAFAASSFEGGGYTLGAMYIDGYSAPTDNSDLIFQTGYVRANVVKIISGVDALCQGIRSNDKLRIAILSNDVLDATLVDPESVRFAKAGVKRAGKNGRLQCRYGDGNDDGLPDLVCSIDVAQVVIEEGALSVDVTAETYDRISIMGNEILCGGQNYGEVISNEGR